MPKRGRNTFKILDLQRALRATKAVGVPCAIVITDGQMTLVPKQAGESPEAGGNTLDGWMKKRGKDARSA
jgi:hypothetical protein